ncbi:MAG: hypothetical protein PHE83_08150 [Opitutaceae bacterium]|nr:hypothetical protein [Opitutaceae bacterium]
MKKNLSLVFGLLLPVTFFFTGCVAGPKDMDRMVQMLERDDPAKFEPVMHSFVACALNDDIDGMIALTSKVTIKEIGLAKLREHYAKDTVPVLKRFPKMSKSGSVFYVDDGRGTTGWTYREDFTSQDGKKAKIQFVVLKEQGVIGIGSVGLWK